MSGVTFEILMEFLMLSLLYDSSALYSGLVEISNTQFLHLSVTSSCSMAVVWAMTISCITGVLLANHSSPAFRIVVRRSLISVEGSYGLLVYVRVSSIPA